MSRQRFVARRGELVPRTIDYRCHRCLLVLPSEPMPTDSRKLGVYGLPKGWTLIVRPRGEDDWCRCVECQRDVERGSPEVLA